MDYPTAGDAFILPEPDKSECADIEALSKCSMDAVFWHE